MSLIVVRRATFGATRLHGLAALLVVVGVLALAGPALASSSVASAWGQGDSGELGAGYYDGSEYANSFVPVEVKGLSGVRSVAAGGYDSLALLEGGTVDAWGENSFGQLGNDSETNSGVPAAVSGLSGVTAIAAGSGSNLALLSSGKVMAWGWNVEGQLGNGTTTNSDVPVEVEGLSGVTAVAAGGEDSLALLSNGTVMAWGENYDGSLGNGTYGGHSDVPVAVNGLTEVAAIAASGDDSLALLKNGMVMAWGDDEQGQLGNGTITEHSDVPVAVCAVGETAPCSHDLSGVTAISASGETFALFSNGTVVTWGGGDLGDDGDTPVAVSNLSEVTAISGSLALLKNGTVMAWGTNLEGELGDPSIHGESLTPVPVSGLSGVTAISGGGGHNLAAGPPPVPFPQVVKVEPQYGAGAGGTTVTITGINFTGVKAVKFGSTNAGSFDVESENKITAVSPAGTGTVDVTVQTAAGTSSTGWRDQFRYAPTVSGVEPDAGFPAGGTAVTITGTNFNEVSAVKFGSINAGSFQVLSENKITAVSPAGTGTVYVTVETRGGTSPTEPETGQFIYTSRPGISRVTPNHGPPSGGTKVTITGSSFTGATEVHFGLTEAARFKVESETKITAISPAFTGGDASMPVFVTSPGGTNEYECGEEQVGFIYEPIVTSVEPKSGPAAGGTEVTIKGADFEGTVWEKGLLCTLGQNVVSWVDFGSTEAKSVSVVSESEITAVVPAGTGTVNVIVKGAPAVRSSPITLGDQFSYGTPIVESESASNITEHGATLEAQINPIIDETEYEFWLECAASCGSSSPERVGTGHIPAGNSGQSVSVDLSDLQPGESYTYWVLAKSSEGKTESLHEALKALSPPPVVAGETASNVTEHDATLEAKINPEGQAVRYQFQVVANPSEFATEMLCPTTPSSELCLKSPITAGALPIGLIEGGSEDQSVSLDLASAGMALQPDTTYHYRVLTTKSVQSEDTVQWEGQPVYGANQTFTTPSSSSSSEQLGVSVITTKCCIGSGTSSTGKTLAFSGLSLPAVQHGDSLVAQLTIGLPGSNVEVEVTTPAGQASSARRKGKPKPVVLARLVRKGVAAGRLKLTVPLNAKGRQELGRHKRLKATVTVVVTPPTGKPQTATHAVTLESR
jgi:alpha-tubulin suppressor-like RCC1 family protein